MKDIFYFSDNDIDLAIIRNILLDNYDYDLLLNVSQDALEIKINEDKIVQVVKMDIGSGFGDPEDLEVIRDTGMTSCVCISHHSDEIDHVKNFLRIILGRFGGWVGNDSEGFEPRFMLADIERFEYSD